MNSFRVRACSALLLAACNHSSPADLPNYGAIGPRAPGPEAILNGVGIDAVWTDDGRGILFSSDCLINQTANGKVPAAALSLIPAVGGSITWQRCEQIHSTLVPRDSVGRLWAQAFRPDGRLLYFESVSPIGFGGALAPFPVYTHAELWLTDSAFPLSRRRKLIALYRDSLGVPTVRDDQVDWLLDLKWTGPNSFVARGTNLLVSLGLYLPTSLHLVRGTIDSAGASLEPVAGTERVRLYSLGTAKGTVLFNRDSLVIERVDIAGGGGHVVGEVPSIPGRILADLSCNATLCLLVTQDPTQNRSIFWTLNPATGVLTNLRTYPGLVTAAKVSPASTSVLVRVGGVTRLFTDLLQ